MLSFLVLGAGIGFVAGVSPGPVLTLVVAETLVGGWLRGTAVAVGPLLADGPIVLVAWLLLAQLPPEAVRALSLVGGVFLLYLAWTKLELGRGFRLASGERLPARGGLLKGVLARTLTPHAYLFWFLVGSQLLLEASQQGWLSVAAFLFGYYSTVVGSNVVIAIALHRWSKLFSEGAYRGLLLFSAAILGAYGLWLLARGVGADL